ncbi:MAG: PadR family transcriptional regulator [Erysipelotrichales bacterium]|nr:PadR family transcriptional regulator [Erysipelotrichales bacterium]
MDIQLKKGLLEVCVLKAISQEDSYGYKIIQDISKIIEISESTLYPILKRLESDGYLTTFNVEYNSRLRKYYHITVNGKKRIAEFIEEFKTVNKIFDYIKEGIIL